MTPEAGHSAIPLHGVRDQAVAALRRAGIPDPEVDADLLIGHVLKVGRGRVQALALAEVALAETDAAAVVELVSRRSRREPLQHITGRAPFRHLNLAVGPGVFVPRPETEQVTQFAIDALALVVVAPDDPDGPIAVDLGTGSGAIGLALATEVPYARVYAVENSPEALAWATRNADETRAENFSLVFADLAIALPELDGRVSVVVSNPPYIPMDCVPLDPEVWRYDPPVALYGGADGLEVIRLLSRTALRLLRRGGTLVLEHGEEQGAAIRQLLTADGWHAAATHRDYTGRDRATTAVR
ncbi:MAG: peptide chain release factor N(5)-glutamine methyltransferase [Microbacteriaceae bacterium]